MKTSILAAGMFFLGMAAAMVATATNVVWALIPIVVAAGILGYLYRRSE